MNLIKLYAAILIVCASASLVVASGLQDTDDAGAQKAAALIRDAIKARGGEAYLNIKTSVSRGHYTQFVKGVPGLPQQFVDYIVYPDRERTEFGKGNTKVVQTFAGNTGWVYNAEEKRIRDQEEAQIKQFQEGINLDLDNLLIRGWQEPGVKLAYLGRREAWKNTFSEAVRIEFKGGQAVTLHLDSRSKLPLMVEYKTVTGEGVANDSRRFFRWVDFGGRLAPTIIDFYREGQQTARASFDTFSFNVDIPEKLFAKPANIKEVK